MSCFVCVRSGKPERDVTITGTQQQIDHARREIDMVLQGVELVIHVQAHVVCACGFALPQAVMSCFVVLMHPLLVCCFSVLCVL